MISPTTVEDADERYVVVSSDAHAGPSLEKSPRKHCPPSHLEQFDDLST
jgi:hypothetical protein